MTAGASSFIHRASFGSNDVTGVDVVNRSRLLGTSLGAPARRVSGPRGAVRCTGVCEDDM